MAESTEKFKLYMANAALSNPTLKFWIQFLLIDCFAYITLYIGMRSHNWNLRMAALKLMGPLFTAFDRPKYSKLIPLHIKEMLTIPSEVLAYLQNGYFAVSILGHACHSVGVDEAHEMCINKDSKHYITRPSVENMNRMASFLSVRAKAIKNLEKQVFADSQAQQSSKAVTGLCTKDTETKKQEINVIAQIATLHRDNRFLPTHEREPVCTTLSHLFNNVQLRPE